MSLMKTLISAFNKMQINTLNYNNLGSFRLLSTNLFLQHRNQFRLKQVPQNSQNCFKVFNNQSVNYTPSIFSIYKNQIRNYLDSLYPDSENRDLAVGEERLNYMRVERRGIVKRRKNKKNPLGENKPFAKGVILKTLIKKPKKPNSANRKCVLVRLSSGKELTAYIPGEGHNLQEHNIVLLRVGRLRDVPGVKVKCVRGAYDLGHVIKKK